MLSIIETKRRGKELSDAQIEAFVAGVTNGTIPDYQTSALLMAICFAGMTERETATLTRAMRDSGQVIDLARLGGATVDKHSTGGVGDTTTLVLAPLVASLGGRVAKMSGRGLGFTGGTIDKLEAIPGFATTLSQEACFRQVEQIGLCVVGQSGDLAPADKKLYALRDVTGTVDSIPLIAASIMSKKLASGAKNLVLDVKCGDGAFMKTPEEAKALARAMVDIGTRNGQNVRALITNMEAPLGDSVGNALEVEEAIEVLSGKQGNLTQLCIHLATHMLCLSRGLAEDDARAQVENALASGLAKETFQKWVAAQGGDAHVADDVSLLPQAAFVLPVPAEKDGYVRAIYAESIGRLACALGAGRTVKDAPIDPAAGVRLCVHVGDFVQKGDILATLHASFDPAAHADELRCAIELAPKKPEAPALLWGVIA